MERSGDTSVDRPNQLRIKSNAGNGNIPKNDDDVNIRDQYLGSSDRDIHNNPEHGLRWRRVQDIFIGATIMGLIVSIAVAIIVQIPVAPYSEIIVFDGPRNISPEAACPGEMISFEVDFFVARKSVYALYITFVDEVGHTVIYDSDGPNVFMQEHKILLHEDNTFLVPELEPGKYYRKIAIVTLDVNSEPTIFVVPFEIPSSCLQ